MSWIRLTYQGATSNCDKDLPFCIRCDQIAGFRPISTDFSAGSVVYFNGMNAVVRETIDEIRKLTGEFRTSEDIGSIRTAA